MKIHLDLDCYFVSAERTRYPFLKHIPVAVAKSSDKKIFAPVKKQMNIFHDTGAFNSFFEFPNYFDRDIKNAWKKEFIDENGVLRGIVIAKSYEAKSKGIKTGMPLKEAFVLCKNLQVIPSDHLFYQQLSQQLKIFLQSQIPLLEQYSIDEFFGDLKGWIKDEDTYIFIKNLQNRILEKFDLPITIGASKSKWIAKLITDKTKPFGVRVVPQEEVFDFTKDIPIKDFSGIGKAIQKKLTNYHIHTLGELQNAPKLLNSYGKTGTTIYKRVCGIDNEKVETNTDRQGVGISRNFTAISDREEIYRRVIILSRYLSYNIIKLDVNPTSFYFKIRYENKLKNSKSITQDRLFSEKFLIQLALKIVKKLDIYPHYKIHYIGINASNFINPKNLKSLSLLDFQEDKKNLKISKELAKIRDKYGVDIIRYAKET